MEPSIFQEAIAATSNAIAILRYRVGNGVPIFSFEYRNAAHHKLFDQQFTDAAEFLRTLGLLHDAMETANTGKMTTRDHETPGNKFLRTRVVRLPNHLLVASEDITQQHATEQELKRTSYETYRHYTILKCAEEICRAGSWEYNVRTGSFQMSDGLYDLFKIERGKPVVPFRLVHRIMEEDRSKIWKAFESLKSTSDYQELTFRIRSNSELTTVKSKIFAERNHKHELQKFFGVTVDISEFIQDKIELEKLNNSLSLQNDQLEKKNKDLTSFAFVASHDLKEPLRKIMFLTDRLQASEHKQLLPEKEQYYLDRMHGAAERMALLIEDVMALAKLQGAAETMLPVNLDEILVRAKEELAESIVSSKATVLSDKLGMIKGDKRALIHLFTNLIGNAIKFRRPDTDPVVELRISDTSVKSLSFRRLRFQDNGIGFDNQYADKIFNIFERLHAKESYEGTGIGLAICQRIMEQHHGLIKASGTEGEGATFDCYFPQM